MTSRRGRRGLPPFPGGFDREGPTRRFFQLRFPRRSSGFSVYIPPHQWKSNENPLSPRPVGGRPPPSKPRGKIAASGARGGGGGGRTIRSGGRGHGRGGAQAREPPVIPNGPLWGPGGSQDPPKKGPDAPLPPGGPACSPLAEPQKRHPPQKKKTSRPTRNRPIYKKKKKATF